ncbi:MAG: carboxypeptidase regulatory-like domain-containing protein [Bryobacteraceae bacterium]|jgi:uncharacterized protein (TIGR03437 family)
MTRGRILAAAAVAAMLGTPAEAYYHYVHFLTTTSPFTALYEKFDLTALPNKTVSIYVTDVAPSTSGNDSFASVLSQVKEAAAQWNALTVSDLRVTFGGLEAATQAPNTPGIDVVFTDELTPGILAETGVTVASGAVTTVGGSKFVPIARSTMFLNVNVDEPPGPSFAETYFTTAVHELGHALGLQHTFTASAMSQAVIRNTTRLRALGPDDVAGLAVLYGKSGWNAAYGSLSGTVTSVGQPVSMASVVALPMTGQPVSTLTNPDGTYEIDGVPPGQYLLYVHPLPPDADIRNPEDAAGQAFAASNPFETLFYPGTRDLEQVTPISVQAGAAIAKLDFTVQARASVPAYDIVTFSYFDSTNQTYSWVGSPVTPAFLNSAQDATEGWGTVTIQSASGSTTVPQSATLLGGFSDADVEPDGQAAALYFRMPPNAGAGPRHLVLFYGNDMYILPDGVVLTTNNPPAISALGDNGGGSVTVSGSNLDANSQILFDGLEAGVVTPFAGDYTQGTVTVTPPPGFGGQNASVVAYNQDGQSSLTLDSWNLANGLALQNPPPTYAYPALAAPQISVSPAQLPAGAFAEVDVTANNMTLVDGQVTLGFGTDDVTVSHVWLSGNHLMANVQVASNAALGTSDISLISGFQVATQSQAMLTVPANPKSPAIALVTNGLPSQATLYPGAYGTIWGSNLAVAVGTSAVTLDDNPVVVAYSSANQVNFVIPSGFAIGPATLKLNNGVDDALPIVVEIDLPPPSISSIAYLEGPGPDAGHPAANGDVLNVLVTGLDPTVLSDPARVSVTLGGVGMTVGGISATTNAGVYQIQIVLVQPPGGDNVPMAVWVDGSSSAPMSIPVQQPTPAPAS